MINIIIQILGIASISNLWADFITSIDKEDKIPTKPFKCEKCISFWVSIVPFLIMYGPSGFFYSAITAMVASYIYKHTAL
jgi:hypothetical protein